MNLNELNDIAARLCKRKGWHAPRYIDNGASAAVYETATKHGRAALKIYDPTFFEGDNALIEVNRIKLQQELRNHGCEYLIDVIDADEIEQDKTWYLLMEFCPWLSLEKRLESVPDERVHDLIKQLVAAVQFLERKNLVHRDIKPANIVVSDDFKRLKLLDFGVLRKIAYDEGSGTDGHKFIATAQYSPPEYLIREEIRGEQGFNAINIYQIGAVLHDLITKTAIFAEEKATKNKFILYRAVTEKVPRIVTETISPRLIALCLAALDKNPQRRVASVALTDLLNDDDDLDAVRRRLAGRSTEGRKRVARPLVTSWEAKVRSWGREAAQLEAETLGSVTMTMEQIPEGRRWRVDFKAAPAPVYLDLVKNGELLEVHILSSIQDERSLPIVKIDNDGPNLPEAGIPGAISAQLLFALDRAVALQASTSIGV